MIRYIFGTKKHQNKVDHQSYDSLIINIVTIHSFTCLLVPVPQIISLIINQTRLITMRSKPDYVEADFLYLLLMLLLWFLLL